LRIFPCGLQATSLFNDTYSIFDAETRKPLPMDRSGIAWEMDMERLANPPGYPDLPGISWLFQRFPTTIARESGVRSDAFAVWLRPAAAPRMQKRYAVLREPLLAGQTISIRIEANFPVSDFGGRKRLILAAASSLGGPDDGLSSFLLIAGTLCWAAAGLLRPPARRPAAPLRRGRERE